MDKIISEVEECPRCGETHRDIAFREFRNPKGRYRGPGYLYMSATHWTLCPETSDPILFFVEDDGIQKVF